MRKTKAALLCAAAVAAGGFTAMAQNVYSLNVVGYINLPLAEGQNLIANQLDLDGTGTNNTIAEVFTNNLPVNSKVNVWNGVGFNQASYAKNKSTGLTNWTANFPLNPGMGAWVAIPAGAYGGTTQQVATVGNVLQGSLANPNFTSGGGLSLLSSMAPISGAISSNLSYVPQLNDKLNVWNGIGFNQYSYAKNKSTGLTNWTPSEPVITVGQGFWLQNAQQGSWTMNFTVQ